LSAGSLSVKGNHLITTLPWSRTNDVRIASPAPYRYSTKPPKQKPGGPWLSSSKRPGRPRATNVYFVLRPHKPEKNMNFNYVSGVNDAYQSVHVVLCNEILKFKHKFSLRAGLSDVILPCCLFKLI